MGAPIAYAMRSVELQQLKLLNTQQYLHILSGIGSENYSETTSSYINSLDPENGLLIRYLELAQIAAIIGDVMFVHGAINDLNMG